MIRVALDIMITRDSGPIEKADVQKGLAVGVSIFWHSGELKELPIKGVEGVESIMAFSRSLQYARHALFLRLKRGRYT